MLAAPRSGMDAPRRSAMQLSESLLLHWRHWMRSVNDTAWKAFQCKRYLCSSESKTTGAPAAAVWLTNAKPSKRNARLPNRWSTNSTVRT